MIDRLIEWFLMFVVPLENVSFIRRRHHCQWRVAEVRLWFGRHLTPLSRDRNCCLLCKTWSNTGPRFFLSLIRKTVQLSRHERQARVLHVRTPDPCGTSILTDELRYIHSITDSMCIGHFTEFDGLKRLWVFLKSLIYSWLIKNEITLLESWLHSVTSLF